MKKGFMRAAALTLAGTMIFSLASCGANEDTKSVTPAEAETEEEAKIPETVYDAMREMQDVSKAEFQYEGTIDQYDQQVSFEINGCYDRDEQSAAFDLEFTLDDESFALKDVVYTDGSIYADLSSVLELADMDMDTLKETLSEIGIDEDDIADNGVVGLKIGSMNKKAISASDALIEEMIKMYESAIGDDEAYLTKAKVRSSKANWTIEVNPENSGDLVEGCLQYVQKNSGTIWKNLSKLVEESLTGNEDLNEILDEISKLSDTSITEEISGAIADIDSYQSDFEDAIEELLDDIDSIKEEMEDSEVSVTWDLEYSLGDNGLRIFEFESEISEEIEEVTMKITGTIEEVEEVSVSAPKEYTDLNKLLSVIVEQIGSYEPETETESESEPEETEGWMEYEDYKFRIDTGSSVFSLDTSFYDDTHCYLDLPDYLGYVYLYIDRWDDNTEAFFENNIAIYLDGASASFPDAGLIEDGEVSVGDLDAHYFLLQMDTFNEDSGYYLLVYAPLETGIGLVGEFTCYDTETWVTVRDLKEIETPAGFAEEILSVVECVGKKPTAVDNPTEPETTGFGGNDEPDSRTIGEESFVITVELPEGFAFDDDRTNQYTVYMTYDEYGDNLVQVYLYDNTYEAYTGDDYMKTEIEGSILGDPDTYPNAAYVIEPVDYVLPSGQVVRAYVVTFEDNGQRVDILCSYLDGGNYGISVECWIADEDGDFQYIMGGLDTGDILDVVYGSIIAG